jgi:CDP-glycerol glycerophosphotransferase (TagB/SpsB family)
MYENVKSTYNVLDIAASVKQFAAMLKLVGTNRKLIEKAYILKAERSLAKQVLGENKKSTGSLSYGLTQKFNEKEYQVLKNFTQDLITMN